MNSLIGWIIVILDVIGFLSVVLFLLHVSLKPESVDKEAAVDAAWEKNR